MHPEQTPIENKSGAIRIGVSLCLLGERCRWNGDHKLDRYILHTLGRYFEFVACCPEFEIGLGAPRETLRLVAKPQGIRLVTTKTGVDYTDAMLEYSRRMVELYAKLGISGYILKKDSPSCGMERMKVYNDKGMAEKTGTGIYAGILLERFPHLPIEEEGRLHDPRLRENFLERVFAHDRLCSLFAGNWNRGRLVAFHTAEKLLLMAHDPNGYRELGRLVAQAKGMDREELQAAYYATYMNTMRKLATKGRHVNVLQHMMGYLRDDLSEAARNDIQTAILDYRSDLVPLIVPITLIRHYVHLFGIEYLIGQHYLQPSPKELALRSYV